jgi:hypothetical protein
MDLECQRSNIYVKGPRTQMVSLGSFRRTLELYKIAVSLRRALKLLDGLFPGDVLAKALELLPEYVHLHVTVHFCSAQKNLVLKKQTWLI